MHPVSYHERKAAVIPDDLSGVTVLDVGAGEGYYSFLAEERGAEQVVAVSLNDRSEQFNLIKSARGSTAEYIVGDVFDLKFAEEFDLVICFGMLYHVPDPRTLLNCLRELAGESLCLSTIIMPSPLNRPFRYDAAAQRTRGGRYQRVWPRICD